MKSRSMYALLGGIAAVILMVSGCSAILASPTPIPTLTPTPIPPPTLTPLPQFVTLSHPSGLFTYDLPVMPFDWMVSNELTLASDYSLTAKSPDGQSYATTTVINAGLPLNSDALDRFVEGWKGQYNLNGVTTKGEVQGGSYVLILEALGYNYFYTRDGIILVIEVELDQPLFDEYSNRFTGILERVALNIDKIKQLDPYQPWVTHENHNPEITMKVPVGWRKVYESDGQFSGRLIFESPDHHIQLIYTILYDTMTVGVHQVLWQQAFSDYKLVWEGDLIGTSAATEHEYTWEGTDASGISVYAFSWEARIDNDIHEWVLAINKAHLDTFKQTLDNLLFFDPLDN